MLRIVSAALVGRGAAALALATVVASGAAPQALGASPERGYELVSPVDKSGGSVLWGAGGLPQANMSSVSADGEQVVYGTFQPFADAAHGEPSSWKATRDANGWSSSQISPRPRLEPDFIRRAWAFDSSDDMSTFAFETFDNFDPLDQDAFPFPGVYFSFGDVYTRTGDGPMRFVSRGDADVPYTEFALASYAGGSGDLSTVAFNSPEALTPDATPTTIAAYLYRRGPDGTRLLNVDGGGLIGQCGASIAGSFNDGGTVKNSVSNDGSRVVFQAPNGPAKSGMYDPSCAVITRLYVNDDGVTTEISASQMTVPDPVVADPRYQGATGDGSVIWFTSTDRLTDDATTGGGLYAFDVESRRLAFLSTGAGAGGAQLRGVLDSTEDGSRVFFLAGGSFGGRGVEGDENIYLWDDGVVRFVTTLAAGDASTLLGTDVGRSARITPSGEHLLFVSSARLTGQDNGGRRSAYVWSAATGEIKCVSCETDGDVPTGDVTLLSLATDNGYPGPLHHRSRNITDDGQRVFFETTADIDPADGNRAIDVYESVNGELRLISDGKARFGARFFDASADGRDVFFATQSSLTGWDVDNGDNDIYDARIGGGFPEPTTRVPCEGEGCQGPPRGAPVFSAPPTLGQPEDPEFNEPEIPSLRLRKVSKKAVRSFAKTGKVTIVLDAGGPGKAAAVATARIARRSVVVASSSKTVSRAGSVRLTLRLSRAARRQLSRRRRLAVTVNAVLTGATPQRTTLVLRAARKAGR